MDKRRSSKCASHSRESVCESAPHSKSSRFNPTETEEKAYLQEPCLLSEHQASLHKDNLERAIKDTFYTGTPENQSWYEHCVSEDSQLVGPSMLCNREKTILGHLLFVQSIVGETTPTFAWQKWVAKHQGPMIDCQPTANQHHWAAN